MQAQQKSNFISILEFLAETCSIDMLQVSSSYRYWFFSIIHQQSFVSNEFEPSFFSHVDGSAGKKLGTKVFDERFFFWMPSELFSRINSEFLEEPSSFFVNKDIVWKLSWTFLYCLEQDSGRFCFSLVSSEWTSTIKLQPNFLALHQQLSEKFFVLFCGNFCYDGWLWKIYHCWRLFNFFSTLFFCLRFCWLIKLGKNRLDMETFHRFTETTCIGTI